MLKKHKSTSGPVPNSGFQPFTWALDEDELDIWDAGPPVFVERPDQKRLLIRHTGSWIAVGQWYIAGFLALCLWLAIGEPMSWLALRDAILSTKHHSGVSWLFVLLSLVIFIVQAWRYSRHRRMVFIFDADSRQITRNRKHIAAFSEVVAVRVWRSGSELGVRVVFLELSDGSEIWLAQTTNKERAADLARNLDQLLGIASASAS